MKVVLRLVKGVTTKTIDIHNDCLHRYRIPITSCVSASVLNTIDIESIAEYRPNIPILTFSWDGKSFWGDKNVKNPIYILDLISVDNY